jgi:hypothetical protein
MNLGYSTAISIMSQAGSLTLTFEDGMKHYKAPQGQHRESLGLLCCAGVECRGIDMYPGTGKT